MRKRIFQTGALVLGLGAIIVLSSVEPAVAMAESRWALVAEAQERVARERAAEAWAELETDSPELHMGCGSTIEDVIDMGKEIGMSLGPIKEDAEEQEQGITLSVGSFYAAEERPFVCVDAGHLGYTREGYKNTGAQSVSGEIEHAWTIKIARVLRDELIARGYDVYMVRDTDEWSEFPYNLGERTTFVNSMECDIMVSIHWDSFADGAVDGYHTIYKGNKKSANYRLAKAISDAYGEALDGAILKYANPQSRDDLWQLNWAEMPTTIVECGFSSNPSDSAWLENEDNFDVIATGIADGIDDYFAGERNMQ